MFSGYLARTINQRTHSHLFLPLILRSLAPHRSFLSPLCSQSTHTFCQAFRRTLSTQSRSRKLNFNHFPTFESSHARSFYETINFTHLINSTNEITNYSVTKLVELVQTNFNSEGGQSTDFIDESGIKPSEDLIVSAICGLKDDWKLAFFVFKWGQKWKCCDEKAWSLMIWVLGNHKKFNNAWCLIKDLYQSKMDTQLSMFIMIDRYAAANEPAEAIRAFQIMEKFKLSPDQKAFYTLLDTLCKHGNVEEAEEFMFQNAKLFPLETEGFNIILYGWCNIFVDIIEMKRIWKEMDKNRVIPDENSYTYMISCFSKVNNLFDSLRLYDDMKKKGWKPNRMVYNSLVYVLAHENCHEEAFRILVKMKVTGLTPDSNTYNYLIRPLCKAGKTENARSILSRMLEENVNPNIDTYHSFLEGKDLNFKESLELLEQMMKTGHGPNRDTFFLLLGKFMQLDDVKNALNIWVKMKEFNVSPDSTHFMMMVDGLVKHGLIVNARELHSEMISVGIPDDPKIKKLLKDSLLEDENEEIKKQRTRNKKYDGRGAGVYRGKKTFRGKQRKL